MAVRDTWEPEVPKLESQLAEMLGVPWKIEIDGAAMYRASSHGQPGCMLKQYLEATVHNLKEFVDKFGANGKQELDAVASAHIITMEETDNTAIPYCGCDVYQGKLRILFRKGCFATNIKQATYCDKLQEALNMAGEADAPLNFNARSGIKADYEPKIGIVKERLEAIIGIQGLSVRPNFEANYAALDGKPGQARDWQKLLGRYTLLYFQGLVDNLTLAGFEKDDMLQEGLQEVMEKKEISFEVVDKLAKGTYNEVVLENGVLCIRTVPAMYNSNMNKVGSKLLDLL